MSKSQKRVVVAMSGGVDSSVAAASLLARGFEVIGMSFRLWLDCDLKSISDPRSCCSQSDMEAAAEVAKTLEIRHTIVDLRDLFFCKVVEPFAREYTMGRTPNPCEACNRWVKFPVLIEAADDLGAEYVATGHYARVERDEGGTSSLLRAAATSKDQSYALYGLGQEELRRCIFPDGDLSKGEIREAASAQGLSTAEKMESQEICFISGGDYRDFLATRFPEAFSPGPICDSSGNEMGVHDGIAFFTIGQRKKLGVSTSHPLYVIALDPAHRVVVVGRREEVPGEWLRAEAAHWIKGYPPQDSLKVQVMARYNTVPLPCRVEMEGDAFEVFFEKRAWALTPGQHAVIYRGDEVLGGGVISSVR